MSKEGALKKYGFSILLTLAIISIVFLIGPAAALILSIDGLPPVFVVPGMVMFFLNFNIGPGELLPGGFTLTIDGSSCSFDSDANELFGPLCPDVSCSVVTKVMGSFGHFNANGFFDPTNYGYGYGYGYRYGYGYKNGELRYKCTWTLPCITGPPALSSISFSTTVDGMAFASPASAIFVTGEPCTPPPPPPPPPGVGGGSNSAAGMGAAHCCDPIVNFGKWHCCQKAYIARIQCCAQPQHPDCSKYCELLECIRPYVMDPIIGRCVMPSQSAPGSGFETPTPSSDGFTGQATQKDGDGTGNLGGSEGGDSNSYWPWWLLLLLLLLIAAYVYWRSRRRNVA